MNVIILYYFSILVFLGIFYGVLFEFSAPDFSFVLTGSTGLLLVFLPIYYFFDLSLFGILILGIGGALSIVGTVLLPLFSFLALVGLLLIITGSFLTLPGGTAYLLKIMISTLKTMLADTRVVGTIYHYTNGLRAWFPAPANQFSYFVHTFLGSALYFTGCLGLSFGFFKKEAQDLPGGVEELIDETGRTCSRLDPEGKIRVIREIWNARAKNPPLDADEQITVTGHQEGTPVVVKDKSD